MNTRNILSATVGGFALLALSACGNVTTPAATSPVAPTGTASNPIADFNTFTQADLTQAIQEAQTASPPDTEAMTCFQFISANLTSLQGQLNGVHAPAGVFSAFETANLALNNTASTLSPVNKVAAETACGPLAQHVANQTLSTAATIASLLGAIGIKVAVPALPVL